MKIISILYPDTTGFVFDFDYYINIHMPLSIKLLSQHPGFKGISVEKGIGSAIPDEKPHFVALCHFRFDTIESFIEAFTPHAKELQGDIKKYTNIEPVIQFNEILISQ